MDEWVEGYDGRVFELGADFQKDPAIQNNEVRVIRGHALRFHVPGGLVSTDKQTISVAHQSCELDITLSSLKAVFTVGAEDVSVSVSVCASWQPTRKEIDDQIRESGWISRSHLFEIWKELGGAETSPEERIGWEKGKLRNRLIRAGAGGSDSLFENRVRQGQTESRLRLGKDYLRLM